MRLKLIVRDQQGDRDVVVTCDATATVGDVAAALAGQADGQRRSQPLTLWAHAPGAPDAQTLNPLLSLHDSGLRSGTSVALVEPRTAPPSEADARATLAVTDGPDAGLTVRLGSGVSFVGRDRAAHVRLRDPLVSRRHASVTVSGRSVVVSDLNSANGVEVDGERVDRAVLLHRSQVRIGSTRFRVDPVSTASGAEATREFSRSPRVVEPWRAPEFEAPMLPSVGERPPLPWIGIAAPIIAGAALFAITQNPLMLLFIALSPILMLGMWVDQVFRRRKQKKEQSARFRTGLASLETDLSEHAAAEHAARLAESPSVSDIAEAVSTRSPLVWTRVPEHGAFLSVRFGRGTLPSRVSVTMPSRDLGATDEWHELKRMVDRFGNLEGVPVAERFRDAGAIGVAGPDQFAGDAARALLLQIAGLHSPADVAVCAFAAGDAAAEWSWVKWLPHTDGPHNPLPTPLAADLPASTRLLSDLEELIQQRTLARGGAAQVRSHISAETPGAPGLWEPVEREPLTPAVVVFIAGDPAVDRGRLVQVAHDGPDVGVYTVWLAGDVSHLPVVCRTYIAARAAQATVSFVRHGAEVALTHIELVDPPQAERVARALAPLEDDGAPVLDESDLPSAVSLVELFDDDIAGDPHAVAGRWDKNDSLMVRWIPGVPREAGGLGALVGQGATAPLRIDLRRDGPHALVGGTTGSGKSEFLQTWILGMAVEHSPDRLTFLLVDYKGGSAFGDCVTLPHTVGLVTDLTPHLVKRALISLRSELKRREEILAAKGAKDLVTLEERGDHDAPPSLVIVIDEFAALVTEVPEFVDGVIDIAQRGRSLGLHLVMATQRPAGVIKESLRANTNLRVALRVADEADSQDVLGIDRAAHFDPGTPGRAAAKLGAGRVIDFQTAYVGGRADHRDAAEVEIRDLPFAPAAAWPRPAAAAAPTSGERDIERLAASIGAASAQLAIAAPRRPWLDALPDAVDLADLRASGDGLAIGMQDEPEHQTQTPFVVDLDAVGNLVVFGTGGVGKTTLLRTLTIAASVGRAPAWVYAIDSVGGALSSLSALPNVGAVIALSDAERVTRLLTQLQEWVNERSRLFATANAATLSAYNRTAANPLPRIIVLIDGMAAFRSEYEFRDAGRLFDGFTGLLTNGRQVGIHFVLTADRQAAIPQSILASLQERIVLRLAADVEYDLMGVPRDALTDAPAGRGYARGREVQIATPGGTADLAAHTQALTDLAREITTTATPVRRLDETIPWASLPATVDGSPTLGVADDTLEPVGITDGLFVVSGPFQSGRTTAMRTIIHAVTATSPPLPAYLLSARPGDLAHATAWTAAGTDVDDADDLANRLAMDLQSGAVPEALIVIESSPEFEATAAEGSIARLLKTARRAPGIRVVVETDTVTAGAAWQIFTELKTARGGIVLQPEETDGAGIFRVPFPRSTRAEFPVGRGFLVTSGRVRRVHVALPPR
ncbi:FtsK/SpoIIIE domain-containing protein [Microbacterium arborescens]|uniref:FtsK/SpoIIIE domain-containing protein n=1 Tax=Microbacterium arborescens TaxID=33883 RepID=UPI0025A2E436|nr:FtsK/SpoIIIE domain-containing protein [Microbacterium arborescens]WJM14892.1 FtsK/SpoIIIE domain-containing protein [Microbacterium arborescens]